MKTNVLMLVVKLVVVVVLGVFLAKTVAAAMEPMTKAVGALLAQPT